MYEPRLGNGIHITNDIYASLCSVIPCGIYSYNNYRDSPGNMTPILLCWVYLHCRICTRSNLMMSVKGLFCIFREFTLCCSAITTTGRLIICSFLAACWFYFYSIQRFWSQEKLTAPTLQIYRYILQQKYLLLKAIQNPAYLLATAPTLLLATLRPCSHCVVSFQLESIT